MLQLIDNVERAAPFIYDTWTSPEVLSIVSKVAGVELVPEMDFEIAHINLSTKSDKQKEEEMRTLADRKSTEADEGIAGCPWEDDKPIVDWHTDSYPFVCVTMLSDCTNMIGGETALRMGDGEVVKVRGPQMVINATLQDPQKTIFGFRLRFLKGMRSRHAGPIHRTPSSPRLWYH